MRDGFEGWPIVRHCPSPGTGSNHQDRRPLRFIRGVIDSSDLPLKVSRNYVARVKEDQEKIYYLLAPTMAAVITSPHL
jgi:hypothetical protein